MITYPRARGQSTVEGNEHEAAYGASSESLRPSPTTRDHGSEFPMQSCSNQLGWHRSSACFQQPCLLSTTCAAKSVAAVGLPRLAKRVAHYHVLGRMNFSFIKGNKNTRQSTSSVLVKDPETTSLHRAFTRHPNCRWRSKPLVVTSQIGATETSRRPCPNY